ncbi:MAG: 3-deoxy-D-manno-octulosonic acid transferase [Acidobacteriota bacterium]|nr:3-deoxy-D-manno-octulosonic acid transferase [Acidobacteriota bacterium]
MAGRTGSGSSPRVTYNSAFALLAPEAATRIPMYLAYSLLLALAMLVALPYFAVQGLRHGKHWQNLVERLGRLPAELIERAGRSPGALWIHAVSVGEVVAAAPLARRLKERFPGRRLVISTTTITGQRMARERIAWADDFFYYPLDWAWVVRRVFRAVRPSLVVILETEIWPNFLRVARQSGVPVLFASARVSERSFRRYRLTDGLIRRVLADASVFLPQTEEDARRLVALGAPEERVRIGGNLKVDVPPPVRNPLAGWLADQAARGKRTPVIVAGSVVAGEENAVLAAFAGVRERYPDALLVLAPRKPERFEAAAQLAEVRGWGLVRRSSLSLGGALDAGAGILLLDTIGELGGLYGVADLVFVGGSLVRAGGHNILEPAALGKAPIFGPHMDNFRDIARRFLDRGAATQVATPAELSRQWVEWLDDPARRDAAGRAARELVEANRGAADRAFESVEALLATGDAR